MLLEQFAREQLILGKEGVEKLLASSVAVFGIGGVGSFTAEALGRAGVGKLTLVDHDTVSLTNLNRQIIALHSTIGRRKTEVMRERLLDINPAVSVTEYPVFFTSENADEFDFSGYDYIVDAIDTVSSKLLLIERAKAAGVPIICSMGTGNKLDPSRFEITEIEKTSVCPLAKVMRRELKKRGISRVKVLYSKEEPHVLHRDGLEEERKGPRPAPGSISFVPSVAGLMIAGAVIRDLTK